MREQTNYYLKGAKNIMGFHQQPHLFVSQVGINVENIERSLNFYQNTIGFQVLEQSAKRAVLTADGHTPLLSIEQPDHVLPKQHRTTGLYHFALLLPNRSELGKTLLHFIQMGYPLQGASDHLVSEAIYLTDPDGNGIEIYSDRPASTWNWDNTSVMMSTEPLDAESLLAAGKGAPWDGLPTGTLMGHLHLHVSELPKTEEFYIKGLGFEVVNRYGEQALFISSGGYHHHIGLNTWNGIGAPSPLQNSVGIASYSLVFPNVAAREKVIMRLQGIGAFVKEEKGVFITEDPSKNRIQLLV